MKIMIQLTFNNGIGNLYCGMIEILNFLQLYKNQGYYIELVFASNGRGGSNYYIDYCNIEELFDGETLNFFDKITNVTHSITTKTYNEYTYHSTQYGPNEPGVHWWDVFVSSDSTPIEVKNAYNVNTLRYKQHVPDIIPKYIDQVYSRVNEFLNKHKHINKSIQIRYFDYKLEPNDDIVIMIKELSSIIKKSDEIFFVSTNNQYILNLLKQNKNVVTYEHDNLIDLPNDHGYYRYHKNFDRDFLLSRLYDNISESVIFENFNTIYHYSSYSWDSTFLYYALVNNPNIDLIKINTQNLNEIL